MVNGHFIALKIVVLPHMQPMLVAYPLELPEILNPFGGLLDYSFLKEAWGC